MAKYKIVAMRDKAVGAFGQPNFVPNLGGVIRQFGDEVNRAGSPENPNNLNLHPGDFELYHLADFDDESGKFSSPEGEDAPVRIASANDFVNK